MLEDLIKTMEMDINKEISGQILKFLVLNDATIVGTETIDLFIYVDKGVPGNSGIYLIRGGKAFRYLKSGTLEITFNTSYAWKIKAIENRQGYLD